MFEPLRQFLRDNPRLPLIIAVAGLTCILVIWGVWGGFALDFSRFYAAEPTQCQTPAPGVHSASTLTGQCGATQNVLSWNLPPGNDSNTILKSVDGADGFVVPATLGCHTSTTYVDTDIQPGHRYTYRHKAFADQTSNTLLCPPSTSVTTPAGASAPTLTAQSSVSSVDVNGEFTVTVRMDTKTYQATAAELRLTFPSDKLQALSVQPGTFLPSVLTPSAIGAGTASITVGSGTSPQQGAGPVMVITFRALAPGSAPIAFSSGTQVAASGYSGNVVDTMTPTTVTVNSVTATATVSVAPTSTATTTTTTTLAVTPTPTTVAALTPTPVVTPSTPTPEPTQTPMAQAAPGLVCTPESQTIFFGQIGFFQAFGGDGAYYNWDGGPGAIQEDDEGFGTAAFGWTAYGTKVVTVRSAGESATCVVEVVNTNPTSSPTPGPTGPIAVSKQARNQTAGQTAPREAVNVSVNQRIEFTIRVTDREGDGTSDIFVRDTLPPGMSYLSGTTTVDGQSAGDGIVTGALAIGSLPPRGERIVRWSALADRLGELPVGAQTVRPEAMAETTEDGESFMRADGVTLTLFGTDTGSDGPFGGAGVPATGPAGATLLALVLAAVSSLLYAAYTRSPGFRRRELRYLGEDQGPMDFRG